MKKKKFTFASNTHKHSLIYTGHTFNSKNDNFNGTLITHSRFHDCTFICIDFRKAAVTGSIFERCTFDKCNLDNADFEFCEFRNCEIIIDTINGCSFNNSNFFVTDFKNILFDSCTFTGAYFEQSDIIKTTIEYSTLEGTCFNNCKFKNLDWRDINLEYVEFIEPSMDNVVLPFFQIPYMFGILKYLANTKDEVRISNDTSDISLDTYFEQGIPFLLNEYEERELYFPISNIYMFGRNTDYNKAFEYLAKEVSNLSSVRDFRGIKFCCKLMATSHLFKRKHLNKIYKNIIDKDISIDSNSAEMKSFARNIGEIRSILFKEEKESSLTIQIKANIGIEYSLRFANLMHQFQKLAKPNHTDKIHASFVLAQNSPLLIDIKIHGDISFFSSILRSFLILSGVSAENCLVYPLVKSLMPKCQADASDMPNPKDILSTEQYYEQLKHDGIELTLLQYYVKNCDQFLDPCEKNYYMDNCLLAITTGDI